MNVDESERERYHELTAYTLSHPDPSFIHQYAVDAFAAQTADNNTKPITLAFALVGLYLAAERQYSGRQVQRVHTLLARRRKRWPSFDIPAHRGAMTVRDVMDTPPGPERDEMIRTWADSVWQAYSAQRDRVVDLLKTELG
jgi:Family of unknown function (DUF5946)